MSLKPWREIIIPHPDVLNGTFQQSEFAADLTAVRTGKATQEYGDAKAFYERWDFAELPGSPYRLFLSSQTLSAMLTRS